MASDVVLREWRLEMPAPAPWLNANQRVDRRAQTEDRACWRDAAHTWAIARKLPKGLARVRITATASFPTLRRRDVDNYAPTVKAVIDGLKRYGLVPDDNAKHVISVELCISDRRAISPLGLLVLDIREVP